MTKFKKYTSQVLATFALPAFFINGNSYHKATTSFEMKSSALELPKINTQGLIDHALELIPKRSTAGVVKKGEGSDLRPAVLEVIKKYLPKKDAHRAYEIARAVIAEANHHKMDPFFLLAVIKTESTFNIRARGRDGEIGLMQIMPATAEWLAPQAGIPAGRIDLDDPVTNIRIGATYFAMLRKNFDGLSHHYVAAYNMGSGNVRKLMRRKRMPKVYPGKVLGNYQGMYKNLAKSIGQQAKVLLDHSAQRIAAIEQQ